jgi:hypothetical protein
MPGTWGRCRAAFLPPARSPNPPNATMFVARQVIPGWPPSTQHPTPCRAGGARRSAADRPPGASPRPPLWRCCPPSVPEAGPAPGPAPSGAPVPESPEAQGARGLAPGAFGWAGNLRTTRGAVGPIRAVPSPCTRAGGGLGTCGWGRWLLLWCGLLRPGWGFGGSLRPPRSGAPALAVGRGHADGAGGFCCGAVCLRPGWGFGASPGPPLRCRSAPRVPEAGPAPGLVPSGVRFPRTRQRVGARGLAPGTFGWAGSVRTTWGAGGPI